MAEHGCWVYAATDKYKDQDLSWLAGVGGTAVRAVPCGSLTAVVSDVDLAEFGADARGGNLGNMEWLERTARAHHHVIGALSAAMPVLPMRLATVYGSEAAMAKAFVAQGAEVRDALARVGGRVEWGVKAYALTGEDEPAQARPASAASLDGGGEGAGLAYLRARRDQLAAQRDSRRGAADSARAVHAELAVHAAQARLHPPQPPQLSGDHRPMLLNASYLVDRDEVAGFTSAVAAVAADHPALHLELTGPWPPYSFTRAMPR
jgi:hypothetical protein